MPRFHVSDTFPIRDKTAYVLAGFMIEGEASGGMVLRLPVNADVTMTAAIDRIQLLHRPDGDVMCLCIRCNEPNEVTLWEALPIRDRTVDIIKAEARRLT